MLITTEESWVLYMKLHLVRGELPLRELNTEKNDVIGAYLGIAVVMLFEIKFLI